MNSEEKARLLALSKTFFLEKIAKPHLRNTEKLKNLSEFTVNPLLDRYLARFMTGKVDPESLAATLILPRVLGTSITTTFGHAMQRFCGDVLQKGFGSTTPGIDVEFVDALDGRKKYCQIKSGPNTINVDDIDTIVTKFNSIRHLARTNAVKNLEANDLCVGVLYGTPEQLNSRYLGLQENHHIPVIIGKNFWYRLTGEPEFYAELAQAFADSVTSIDSTRHLNQVTNELAQQIARRKNA